jgi:hypothetical protein
MHINLTTNFGNKTVSSAKRIFQLTYSISAGFKLIPFSVALLKLHLNHTAILTSDTRLFLCPGGKYKGFENCDNYFSILRVRDFMFKLFPIIT